MEKDLDRQKAAPVPDQRQNPQNRATDRNPISVEELGAGTGVDIGPGAAGEQGSSAGKNAERPKD